MTLCVKRMLLLQQDSGRQPGGAHVVDPASATLRTTPPAVKILTNRCDGCRVDQRCRRPDLVTPGVSPDANTLPLRPNKPAAPHDTPRGPDEAGAAARCPHD